MTCITDLRLPELEPHPGGDPTLDRVVRLEVVPEAALKAVQLARYVLHGPVRGERGSAEGSHGVS